MADFFSLKVQSIERNTPQSVVVDFEVPQEHKDTFKYQSGQYLTFRYKFFDEELRRSYSICCGESSESLQVGIKKVHDGVFSTFANEELKVGDSLEIMPPMGKFTLNYDALDNQEILMIAAGSGITPMISHIETAFARSDSVKITLIYGNKTPASTMFRTRVEDLKNIYLERFSIIYVLSSSQQDIEMFSGRVTSEKCKNILKYWFKHSFFSHAYICGPEVMIYDIRDGLLELGWDKSQIKYELFGTSRRKKTPVNVDTKKAADVELTLVLEGVTHVLDMHLGESVLDVAQRNNLDAPYSCLAGVCSTCRCKVLEGTGEMETNHALEDYEVERGYALSCQFRASSPKLTISYDAAGH